MPLHILLSYGIMYFILPKFIFKNRYALGILMMLTLMAITAALSPLISKWIIAPLWKYEPPHIKDKYFYGFMAGLRGSTTIAGFATALKLIKQRYLKKEESSQLEKEKLKAELQVLKGQLHPHFMFNTLNSLYALSLKHSDQTPAVILKLSEFMRYMITDCNDTVIPLKKEVQMLLNYVELERSRFGERLDISLNIEGDVEDQKIIPLLFLPFLENSFKYGTHEMLEQAWISLDLITQKNILKFKIINGRASRTENGSGIGLQNVRKRLEMLYPSAHELRISENPDTFVVTLTVQLDRLKLP